VAAGQQELPNQLDGDGCRVVGGRSARGATEWWRSGNEADAAVRRPRTATVDAPRGDPRPRRRRRPRPTKDTARHRIVAARWWFVDRSRCRCTTPLA